MPTPAMGFRILTDVNTLARDHIREDGVLNYDKLNRIKSDGVWSVGSSNVPGPERHFNEEEWVHVYNALGPGYVVAEDGCYTIANYKRVFRRIGYVDDYMSYFENWFLDRSIVPSIGCAAATVPHSTTLLDSEVEWVLDELESKLSEPVESLSVLTRAYHGNWRPRVDERLADDRVSGIVVEMFSWRANIDAWHIDELVRKTLDAGKKFYLLVTPKSVKAMPVGQMTNYTEELRKMLPELRETGRLSDPRLFIVLANYGGYPHTTTTWFGLTDSVESSINFLKDQPEYQAEPVLSSTYASSELPLWSHNKFMDGFQNTVWSSIGHRTPNHREQIAFWWDSKRPINYIRLRPRWDGSSALSFPESFIVYYSDCAEWIPIYENTNFLTPTVDDWITIEFNRTVDANGILVATHRLGSDGYNYYFQLSEATAGYTGERDVINAWSSISSADNSVLYDEDFETVLKSPSTTSQGESVQFAYWWDDFRQTSHIKLRPYIEDGQSIGFPVDFIIHYSHKGRWVFSRHVVDHPVPTEQGWVEIPLHDTVMTNGIHITVTRLGLEYSSRVDPVGPHYSLYLSEVTARYGEPVNF